MLLVNGLFLITIEDAGFLYSKIDAHSLFLSVNRPHSITVAREAQWRVVENAHRLFLGLEELLPIVSSVLLLFLNTD